MQKLKREFPLTILGIDVTKPGEFLDQRSATNSQNFEIIRSVLQKRPGTEAMGASLAERVLRLPELKIGTLTYFVRIGLTKVELYDKNVGTWSSIASAVLTGTVAERVDHTFPLLSGAKVLVFTNGKDNIRKYTGTGNDADLGGTPPKARYCIAIGPYLLLAYVTSGASTYRSRVQWCDTGNIENWSTGNAGSKDLIDDQDEITGVSLFGDYVAVHKSNSIYIGYLVSTSEIFRFDRKNTGVGTCCFDSIKMLPTGEQIFLAFDGLHLFNGVSAPRIAHGLMDEIAESLNPQYLYKSWGQIVNEKNEYWVGVPIGSQSEPETVYKYNFVTGQCYKDSRANISCSGQYESIASDSWNSDSDSWDSDVYPWDFLINTSLFRNIAFGDKNGVVSKISSTQNDVGIAIDAFWDSKDFTSLEFEAGGDSTLMRWTGIQIWAKGQEISIYYSTDSGESWSLADTLDLESSYPSDFSPKIVYFDTLGTKLRIRFKNNNLAESVSIKNFAIEAIPREEII